MKFGIRELVFVAVLLGVLGCAYFVIFQKANAHRIAVEADTQSKRQKLAELQSATAGISDLNHKIDELQRAIDFFHSKLPQQREVETILNEVTRISQINGLRSKTFKTMNGEVTANYTELPIDLNLSGDFTGFYAFLLQLEKLPRLTRITHMKLEKINEHDGQMTASLTLSIYYEPDQALDNSATADARLAR